MSAVAVAASVLALIGPATGDNIGAPAFSQPDVNHGRAGAVGVRTGGIEAPAQLPGFPEFWTCQEVGKSFNCKLSGVAVNHQKAYRVVATYKMKTKSTRTDALVVTNFLYRVPRLPGRAVANQYVGGIRINGTSFGCYTPGTVMWCLNRSTASLIKITKAGKVTQKSNVTGLNLPTTVLKPRKSWTSGAFGCMASAGSGWCGVLGNTHGVEVNGVTWRAV